MFLATWLKCDFFFLGSVFALEAVNTWGHKNYVDDVKCDFFCIYTFYGCCSKFGHLIFMGDKGDSSNLFTFQLTFVSWHQQNLLAHL